MYEYIHQIVEQKKNIKKIDIDKYRKIDGYIDKSYRRLLLK